MKEREREREVREMQVKKFWFVQSNLIVRTDENEVKTLRIWAI